MKLPYKIEIPVFNPETGGSLAVPYVEGWAHQSDEVEIAADAMLGAVDPEIAAEAALLVLGRLGVALIAGVPGKPQSALIPGRGGSWLGGHTPDEGVRWDLLRNTLYQAGARKGALMLPQTRPVLVDMGILGAELRDLSIAYPKPRSLP